MAVFVDLPVDIMFNIFNRCSRANTRDISGISPNAWKRDLRYLAVCHNLRAAAACVHYRVAFLHIKSDVDRTPTKGRLSFGSGICTVVSYANISLIRQNGVSHFAHKADIIMSRGNTPSARFRCLYHAITGEVLADEQNATAGAEQAVLQFAELFPRITELSLQCSAYEKSILAALHRLCSCYAGGLRKVSYEMQFGIVQPLRLTGVEHVVLRSSDIDNGKLTIAPEPIQTLSLDEHDYWKDWRVFCAEPSSTTITFSNLKELRMLASNYNSIRFNNPRSPIYMVKFPKLRKLLIKHIYVDEFVTQMVQQSPIRELRLCGSPEEIYVICNLGIAKLDVLDLDVYCSYGDEPAALANDMNSILQFAAGIKTVHAMIAIEQHCDLGESNWNHLTHLMCHKYVSLKALFHRINSMPDLVCLKVDLSEWAENEMDVCRFFEELSNTFTVPFKPKIAHIGIWGMRRDSLSMAQGTVQKFKYLFPRLQCLRLNDCAYY